MDDYIVSARKYRPASFKEVAGQKGLTTTLSNAVRSGRIAHAYLFCGPRGVGKTTCARIFAKAINCLNPSAEGEACGVCESCKAFGENRSYNIFELDAASNNSVEDIKNLMEQTRIPPQIGRYKVFIIDEAHMLSTAAFNAFLKTLEEPPAHVVFILATTEKHKVPPTIISRCQIYDFERISARVISDYLKKVAIKEKISFEDEALDLIAEKADGGMRDALSIFDQSAAFSRGNITYAKVIEDLNILDEDYFFRLVDLSLENKVSDIILLVDEIIGKGFEPGNIILGLARHTRRVMLAKDPPTVRLLEVSARQRERFKEQAKRAPAAFLYKSLRLMNRCDTEYRQSNNKRLLAELTLIETAQITQPVDGAAQRGGHDPRVTLKPIFNNNAAAGTVYKKSEEKEEKTKDGKNEDGKNDGGKNDGGKNEKHDDGKDEKHDDGKDEKDDDGKDEKHDDGKDEKDDDGKDDDGKDGKDDDGKDEKDDDGTDGAVKVSDDGGVRPFRRPRLKDGGVVGFTWRNKRREEKRNEGKGDEGGKPFDTVGKETADAPPAAEGETFTDDDLRKEWKAMCRRLPPPYAAMADRMELMTPVITDYPNVEVTVENEPLLAEFQKNNFSRRIQATLRQRLRQPNLSLTLRAARKENRAPEPTRKELLAKMSKENPAVTSLLKTFALYPE